MLTVSGLILLLAGSGWFAGASTVGWILLGVGVVAEIVPFCLVVVAGWLSLR